MCIATTTKVTTLYGMAMLVLSIDPVHVTIPEVKHHHWSIEFDDN